MDFKLKVKGKKLKVDGFAENRVLIFGKPCLRQAGAFILGDPFTVHR